MIKGKRILIMIKGNFYDSKAVKHCQFHKILYNFVLSGADIRFSQGVNKENMNGLMTYTVLQLMSNLPKIKVKKYCVHYELISTD